MTHRWTTLAAALVFVLAAPRLASQVTERPVAFDSIGRVPSITPRLADRLRLGPPLWPVLGSFVSAQLFSKSTGGYTLVVARGDGSFDRYDLSAEAAEGLRMVVATALERGERSGVGEQTTVASDPAGNAFVRNQALLGVFLYGPAAAQLVASGTSGASAPLATELITASGAFAAALARRNMLPPVTTAQNRLSTHAALHGAAIGDALVYAAGALNDGGAAGSGMLAGSIGGTLLGLHFARNMTDAEAASASYGADFTAAASLGILGTAGALEHESAARPAAVIASTAMLAGYVAGPIYPRRARYTVTDGDVRAMTLTSAIGIAAAAIPFIGNGRPGTRTLSAALTAGMVTGALAGDRLLVRPRDHTTSEATLLWTGAGVGAFLGGGVAALGDASLQPAWALSVGGALLGAAATEAAIRPRPAGRRILSDRGDTRSASAIDDAGEPAEPVAKRMQITFDPIGAVFAATSKLGTFSVLRVVF